MKNLKKLISVIIAVIMIVGSFATVSAADYKDVESTNSFAKAINVLSGLGIVNGDDEGNFNPKNEIKRSEMVALVCRMMGEEDIANNSASNAFTDVAANHWAAGNIAWGVNRGIINGMGDGTFAPDASVSYQDAVVMIMRALGYDRIAQRAQNGGYPGGYLKLASQRGILKDAGYDNQAAAPREVVAQLIYNAMTAPLVDVKQYGMNVEDDRYIIHDGSDEDAPLRTLLTYTNEIIKVKADITDTAKTNAGLIDKDGSYKVVLNVTNGFGYSMKTVSDTLTGIETATAFPVTVYAGETDAADLLGATVEAYLVEDEDLNGAWKLLAVVADAKSVKSETVKAAEVDFKDYAANVFKYEDADGQEEEIELASGADLSVYYNGKKVDTADNFGAGVIKALMLAAEEITFTGSRTGDYDKVFITDYAYHQVKKVYAEDLYINANGLDLELDPEVRGNKKFTYGLFDANGAAIELADIAEDDILNIVAPLTIDPATGLATNNLNNVAYMDIYVTDNAVTGTVEEVLMDGSYDIGGNAYKMVSGSLTAGAEGIFYVTIDGRILAYDASANLAKDFGFIVRAYSEGKYDNTVFENTIRMFTKEGKLVNFLVADRLTIKGTVVTAGTYTDAALNTMVGTTIKALAANNTTSKAATQASLANRVVTYKLNAEGEIRELVFAGDGITATSVATGKDYRDDINTFGTKKIADDSVLFVAPVTGCDAGCVTDHNGAEAGNGHSTEWYVDEDDLSIGNFDAMDEDKAGGYNAATFVFNTEARTLAAAIVAEDIDSSFAGAHLAVVKARGTVADKEYDSLVKYTFIQGGETINLTVAPEAKGNIVTLNAGDVIRYAVDADGNIDSMQVIYTASTKTFNNNGLAVANVGDDSAHDIALVYGYIDLIEDGVMTVDQDLTAGTDIIDRLLGEGEGNTYASINEDGDATAITSNDVTLLRSSASLRASVSTKKYRVIAVLTEDDAFEDCVMIIE